MRLDQAQERARFEIADDVSYLNTASICPQLRSVRAAAQEALERSGRPWTIAAEDWFSEVERLRELFGRVLGADAEGIAIVPSTSYGFAVAAANLEAGPGDRVLVLDEEYPSGVYTWQAFTARTGAELVTVRREPGQSWREAVESALDERVRVVSLPNVHWTNGSLVDLEPLAERARALGAALALDLSQSAGALPVDLRRLRPDFAVTVGYKWLLGPFSAGCLYVDERYREGRAIEHNWVVREGAERFAGLVDYTDRLQPGARRFDVGQRSNFVLNPMAIAALEQILAWSVEGIAAALAELTAAIERGASERGLTTVAAPERGPHMIGIELPSGDSDGVAAALAERGVHVGPRSSWLRISPHLHATGADVERLFTALDEIAAS